MQKQQFGPNASTAVPGMLDEEVEAAYKQFGRALGETPRETSKAVRAKYNIPAALPQPAARRPVSSGDRSERCKEAAVTLFLYLKYPHGRAAACRAGWLQLLPDLSILHKRRSL